MLIKVATVALHKYVTPEFQRYICTFGEQDSQLTARSGLYDLDPRYNISRR